MQTSAMAHDYVSRLLVILQAFPYCSGVDTAVFIVQYLSLWNILLCSAYW